MRASPSILRETFHFCLNGDVSVVNTFPTLAAEKWAKLPRTVSASLGVSAYPSIPACTLQFQL